MTNHFRAYIFILLIGLTACNPTKFIPDGEYLLDNTRVYSDTKELKKSELKDYLRQTENFEVFGIFKMQLGIYNWAGRDSSKWINRTLKKIGDPPVIYNPMLTSISVQQLQKVIENKGFFNGRVEAKIDTLPKKVRANYYIASNKPYTIRNYTIQLEHDSLNLYAADTTRSLIRANHLFNVDLLNEERERVALQFRQRGYYNFNKEFLVYKADSSLNTHQVDLRFELQNYLKDNEDSIKKIIFKRFKIRKVIYYTNTDPTISSDLLDKEKLDSTSFKDFILISPKEQSIISLDALVHNTYINPGRYYSERSINQTYAALNTLGPIKYTNISFKQIADSVLDCYIIITPNKFVSLSTDLGLTYTDGFWGVAGGVSTTHRNLFKGAETLSIQAKVSLEKQLDLIAQETGVQVGLKFPRFMLPIGSYDFKRNLRATTEFTSAYNYQFRPGEYESKSIGGGIKYAWARRQNKYNLDLFDLSYVYFPVITPNFREQFLTTGIFNDYNYKDHFITRLGYSISTSTFSNSRPYRSYTTRRYSLETAGNLLTSLNKLMGYEPSTDGYFKLFGIRYSQYTKGEFGTTFHQIINRKHRFVYRFLAGAAIPYGNGDAIPWEKRFYSGGANSVRGWSESTLGPGVYKRIDLKKRDYNQVGDIKLDMNMEYRALIIDKWEGALFLDAGNIWTIKPYDSQQGGEFRLNSFMKQIALAYGIGIRRDFSFFIGRVDFGVRLNDPVLPDSQRWRINPTWKDCAVHIAIGYPF